MDPLFFVPLGLLLVLGVVARWMVFTGYVAKASGAERTRRRKIALAVMAAVVVVGVPTIVLLLQ